MIIPLDTETKLFAPGDMAPGLVSVAIGNMLYHRTTAGVLEALRDVFDHHTVIGHHIAYDCVVLLRQFPELWPSILTAYQEERVTCTLLRQRLVDIASGNSWRYAERKGAYSLKGVVQRELGLDLEKGTVQVRFGELYDTPLSDWPEAFRQYALTDTAVLKPLYLRQAQRSIESGESWLEDEYRQARAGLWLQLCSVYGITTDPAKVAALKAKLEAEQSLLFPDVASAGVLRIGGTKREPKIVQTQAVIQRLVSEAWNGDPPKTEKGAVQTDKDALTSAPNPSPALKSFVRYKAVTRLLGDPEKGTGLIPMLSQPLIHTRFNVCQDTGRTSSGGDGDSDDGGNIQNLNRSGGIRECLTARPGHLLVCSDYGMLELCTLGQAMVTLFGRSTLSDALNAGRDPHSQIAAALCGLSYEECRTRREEKTPWNGVSGPSMKDLRQTGKVANFGFPGGLGAAALVHFAWSTYGVRLTEAEARSLKAVWLRTWPDMARYFDWVNAQVSGPDPYIRQLFSNRVRRGVTYCSAANTVFQGLGADVTKDVGWYLMRECYVGSMSPARLVNFVHDEFVTETPAALARSTLEIQERIMLERSKRWLHDVRIGVESKIVKNYGGQAVA